MKNVKDEKRKNVATFVCTMCIAAGLMYFGTTLTAHAPVTDSAGAGTEDASEADTGSVLPGTEGTEGVGGTEEDAADTEKPDAQAGTTEGASEEPDAQDAGDTDGTENTGSTGTEGEGSSGTPGSSSLSGAGTEGNTGTGSSGTVSSGFSDAGSSDISSGSSSSSSSGTSAKTITLIKALGDVDSDFLAQANARLAVVPDSLLSAFVSEGWAYYASEWDIDDTFFMDTYGELNGVTIVDTKLILLDCRESALDCVVHEFGHFVDEYLGVPSQSDTFSSLYSSESDAFCSAFGYSNGDYYNEREFFAEAFKDYLESPEVLSEACPKTYAYMEKLLVDY